MIKKFNILETDLDTNKVQIARNIVSKLMRREFGFSMKNILNETLLFDTKKIGDDNGQNNWIA